MTLNSDQSDHEGDVYYRLPEPVRERARDLDDALIDALVREDLVIRASTHRGAVSAERERIIARLVEMANVLDQDAVACTAETLRRAAAVLDVEGGGR